MFQYVHKGTILKKEDFKKSQTGIDIVLSSAVPLVAQVAVGCAYGALPRLLEQLSMLELLLLGRFGLIFQLDSKKNMHTTMMYATMVLNLCLAIMRDLQQNSILQTLNKEFLEDPKLLYFHNLIYGSKNKVTKIKPILHAIRNATDFLPFVASIITHGIHTPSSLSFTNTEDTSGQVAAILGSVLLEALGNTVQTKIEKLIDRIQERQKEIVNKQHFFEDHAVSLLSIRGNELYKKKIQQMITDSSQNKQYLLALVCMQALLNVLSNGMSVLVEFTHPFLATATLTAVAKLGVLTLPNIGEIWRQFSKAWRFHAELASVRRLLNTGQGSPFVLTYDPSANEMSITNASVYRPARVQDSTLVDAAARLKEQMQEKYRLYSLNCAFKPGSIVYLKGPSGVGKSTLLNLLNKMWVHLKPTDPNLPCEIVIPAKEEECLYLSQNPILPPGTLFDAIAFPKNISFFEDKEKVISQMKSLLEKLGLAELKPFLFVKKKWQNQLSRGQQQRLFVLKAFLLKPKIVFFDETWASVDAATTQKIVALIRKQLPKSIVFFITHNLGKINFGEQIETLDLGQASSVTKPLSNHKPCLFSQSGMKKKEEQSFILSQKQQTTPKKHMP